MLNIMTSAFCVSTGEPVTGMYISPSVTPWKLRVGDWIGPPHNPALRRYIFDRSTYELVDIQQYYLDLVMVCMLSILTG